MTENWEDLGYDGFLTKRIVVPESKIDSSDLPAILSGGGWKGNFTIANGYLQSKGFVSGSTGWRIDSDGDLEANSGTFRGNVTGATITGGRLRTSVSGERVELYNDLLTIYDTNGRVFEIEPTGGVTGLTAQNFYDTTGLLGSLFATRTGGSGEDLQRLALFSSAATAPYVCRLALESGVADGDDPTAELHGHFVPSDTDTYDLGTSVLKFKNLYLSGLANVVGLDIGSQKITNLLDPTEDTDGANKEYVDDATETQLVTYGEAITDRNALIWGKGIEGTTSKIIDSSGGESVNVGFVGCSSGLKSEKVKQTLQDYSSYPSLLRFVTIRLKKVGSPTDNVTLNVKKTSDDSLLGTGTIANASITTSYQNLKCSLTSGFIMPSEEIYVEVARTGALNDDNYFMVGVKESNIYGSGDFYRYASATWIAYGYDFNILYLAPQLDPNKVYQGDADDLTRIDFAGFALESGTAGQSKTIQTTKIVSGLSGLTTGTIYYLSGTAGAITSTAPDVPIKVGVAISSTTLLIQYQKERQYIEMVPVERSNPNANTWEDWDLSASIPAGAKYAEIVLGIYNTSNVIGVRKNGSALNRYISTDRLGLSFNMTVELDTNRIIESYMADVRAKFYCVGYWI